jgi:selenide, water dikinase
MTDEEARTRRLTERVSCGGCASKLGPAELSQVLRGLPASDDPRVLVDYRTGDDAGVFRLDDQTGLVQTVDFFTPVVDDPESFGAIAAANALSDVYAMGGRPLTALSIAAFPEKDFPPEWASAIVQGGAAKLREAGCALLGGHTVRDPEIKFGYAITGLVSPARMLTNASARPGDALVLTKPLGTGVIGTALKAGHAPAGAVAAATRSMTTLNREAAEAALRHDVHAATDVTGFGLVGHALNIARESGVTLEFWPQRLPLFEGVLELAPRFQAGGLKANRAQFAPQVEVQAELPPGLEALFYDPQTSGGLLVAVPEAAAAALVGELPAARIVGRVVAPGERRIRVAA